MLRIVLAYVVMYPIFKLLYSVGSSCVFRLYLNKEDLSLYVGIWQLEDHFNNFGMRWN